MTDTLIPNGIPPDTGWYAAAILGLLALGKPALDMFRALKAKSLTHSQSLEMRAIAGREAEDRLLLKIMQDELQELKKRLRELEDKYAIQGAENSRLVAENAVLSYRLSAQVTQ
jgi:hypothetical protein